MQPEPVRVPAGFTPSGQRPFVEDNTRIDTPSAGCTPFTPLPNAMPENLSSTTLFFLGWAMIHGFNVEICEPVHIFRNLLSLTIQELLIESNLSLYLIRKKS